MPRFSVGDIVIGQNFINATYLNGMEGEVIDGYKQYHIGQLNGEPCEPYYIHGYAVKWADGHVSVQRTRHLRKKQPPEHEAGSWNAQVFTELGWNPTKMKQEIDK